LCGALNSGPMLKQRREWGKLALASGQSHLGIVTLARPYPARKPGSKQFFFEKKNQKTLTRISKCRSCRPRQPTEQKFFGSFFKKELLPGLGCPTRPSNAQLRLPWRWPARARPTFAAIRNSLAFARLRRRRPMFAWPGYRRRCSGARHVRQMTGCLRRRCAQPR